MDEKASSSTIDETNLKIFSGISEDWWDLKGPMSILHALNKLRVPFIRNCLINNERDKASLSSDSRCLGGIKILDVGCGGGILSIPLACLGACVVGIDPVPDLVKCAQSLVDRLPTENRVEARFETCTIEDHAKANPGLYDVVVASEVVEHVNNQEMFLSACVDALKPGGSLFITTYNRTNLAWLSAIVYGEYISRMIPVGSHEYSKFISVDETERILTNLGCTTTIVNGYTYLPIIGWIWIPTTSTFSYALHAVKDKKE